jgi:hypothetical protein
VDGNSICAGEFALDGCPDGVGLIGQSGLPDGCDMVNIDI